MEQDIFLTVEEAAEILKVDTRHIKRLIKAGKLRAKNIGVGTERKFYRVLKKDLLTVKNGLNKS